MNYDETRIILINDIQQLLINIKHNIIDFYVNEWGYGTDYDIMTDKNTISLRIFDYSHNINSLFDSMVIYDYNEQNTLAEFELNEKHTSIEILELFLSHFKSSMV